MATEVNTNNLNWTSFVGTTLGGVYLLERLASAEEGAASFLTRTGGEHSAKAMLRLIRAEGDAAERQMQIWQAVKKRGHPHLLPIWGTGRTNVEGQDYLYVVVQAADENLAGVLAERPLEPAEAGEVLVSLAAALSHLHAHRMVHGSVSPEQIFAVGETVKLSTEGVRRLEMPVAVEVNKPRYAAPESTEGNVTPAADIWCLGATLVEVFTRQGPWEDYSAETGNLPAPFNEIAKVCLQKDPEARTTLSHILDLYEGKETHALQGEPAAAKQMAAAAGVGLQSSFALSGELPAMAGPEMTIPQEEIQVQESEGGAVPAAEPQSVSEPERAAADQTEFPIHHHPAPSTDPSMQEAVQRAKRRAWILVAVALAILVIVVWFFRPRAANQTAGVSSKPAKATNAVPGQTMTLPATGQSGATEDVTRSQKQTPAAHAAAPQRTESRPAAKETTSSLPARSGPIWKVILYTYNRADDAEKRAARINSAHPGLDATVFAPKGEGRGPYLVVIGGTTNREQAVQLRRKAIQAGLPRDAYLQNYNR